MLHKWKTAWKKPKVHMVVDILPMAASSLYGAFTVYSDKFC